MLQTCTLLLVWLKLTFMDTRFRAQARARMHNEVGTSVLMLGEHRGA